MGLPPSASGFFGVAQANNGPISWPERTHAPRKDAKRLGLKPWGRRSHDHRFLIAREVHLRRKKDLAEATLRLTARGVMRYVINAAKPFIVPITHSGAERGSLGRGSAADTDDGPSREMSVAIPHLAVMRNSGKPYSAADEPLQTLTAGGANPAVVSAAISPMVMGVGGRAAQTETRDLREPIGAGTTKGRSGTAFGVRCSGSSGRVTARISVSRFQPSLRKDRGRPRSFPHSGPA